MKKFFLLCGCLVFSGLQASDCEYEEMIDQTLDLSGSEELSVMAGAGDLRITGLKGGEVALIKAVSAFRRRNGWKIRAWKQAVVSARKSLFNCRTAMMTGHGVAIATHTWILNSRCQSTSS